MCGCVFLLYFFGAKDSFCFHRYSLGSRAMKRRQRQQQLAAWGLTPASKSPTSSHTDQKIKHAHKHRNWESCREAAPSYNIILFECFFALHPAECYYNTVHFYSTLGEERQYICHLTKKNPYKTHPACSLSVMLCITVSAKGGMGMMPHI